MALNKVYIQPRFSGKDKADGGIRRVIDALVKYLPDFGWEVVDTPEEADVIHCHAGNLVDAPDKPLLSSNHGYYWSDYEWGGDWADKANMELMQAMSVANAHTAPSKWVSNAIRRGTLYTPEVIYHGVEADEFGPMPSQGFVLWNKARKDTVSDPAPVRKLAELMPDTTFVTTLLDDWSEADPDKNRPKNVNVCGVMNYAAMKRLLPFAGVYLATTRETFGIGTLEAMACGVPVAGWDYGGQSEIILDGETGYLAPYGDYEALARCVRLCLENRDALSKNCIADVHKRWAWPDKIQQYAALYNHLYTEAKRLKPKVSVIIPCYNLAKFLPQAVKSVQAQTMDDYELLIVDDCSTDHSWNIALEMAQWDFKIKVYRTPKNLGLCGTRNFGISKARGKYIQFLDADDLLTPHALAVCSEVLDHEPGIHIAYGHLDVINETGTSAHRNNWPEAQFSYWRQMAHLNEPHYSAMVRRTVYEKAGGYRWRHRKAEDAWFWCYVTSYGFYAEKVTDCTTLLWRSRSNSKSITERENDTDLDGDWTAEFPWAIAHSAQAANEMQMQEGDIVVRGRTLNLFPFGCQAPPLENMFWNVWHQEKPMRTITINGLALGTYCDENWQKLIDLLDPVRLQEDRDWRCVVKVPADWPAEIPGANWAQIVRVNSEEIPVGELEGERN